MQKEREPSSRVYSRSMNRFVRLAKLSMTIGLFTILMQPSLVRAQTGETITTPDPGAIFGEFTALALNSNGYPLVSHYDGLHANTVPEAANDVYSTADDASLTVNAENGVLANDSDVDGDELTAKLVNGTSNGTLILNSDGSFTYSPIAGYIGSDTFTYTANDGISDSETATVTITVDALVFPIGGGERISVDDGGVQGNDGSFNPSASSDGRYVAFYSLANNLVSGDTNGEHDVFVRDRVLGTIVRASVSSSGAEGNGRSDDVTISDNGHYVVFQSEATNLINNDGNGIADIFVHALLTGETTRVSVNSSGAEADGASNYRDISGDGRYVVFASDATNLVSGDNNSASDVFVHDRDTGVTSRVSVDSNGQEGNAISREPSISSDGRYVAFTSDATNLVSGDTNGSADVFVHDRDTGVTSRVSVDSNGQEGDGISRDPAISSDGRYVAFTSNAINLVNGDGNDESDIFVHDREMAITTRVSVDSSGQEGDENSFDAGISSDGRYVTFSSNVSTLVSGDYNDATDVFVHDRETAETVRLTANSRGIDGNGDSTDPEISGNGCFVTFESAANNIVSGDTNGVDDVFVALLRVNGVIRQECEFEDSDGDGVSDADDLCANTSLTNDAPPQPRSNRYFVNAMGKFVDAAGNSSGYTISDTGGCSSKQIIEAVGLGSRHQRNGLSRSALIAWIIVVDDHDGDGRVDDYDPDGHFYLLDSGEIIAGGRIEVSGPSPVRIDRDGSNGYYEWTTVGEPGLYVMTITPPAGYRLNPNCPAQPDAITPSGDVPIFLGASEVATTAVLADATCAGNPYYLQFNITEGAPFVFNNNIPLEQLDPTSLLPTREPSASSVYLPLISNEGK